MKKCIYFFVLQSTSLIFCSLYEITPFVSAISKRIYYLARLDKPIQFLKLHCSNYTREEEECIDEWDRFRTFRQVQNTDYEKDFVKQVFKVLYEDTVTTKGINKDDLQLLQQVSTDDIAFRYFLIQRLEHLFTFLQRVKAIRCTKGVLDRVSGQQHLVTHTEIHLLLLEIFQNQTLDPLLKEWEHIVYYKNLSDILYMQDFLVLTYLCIQCIIQEDAVCLPSQKNISYLLAKLDGVIPILHTKMSSDYLRTIPLLQRIGNMGIPLAIIVLLAVGQMK